MSSARVGWRGKVPTTLPHHSDQPRKVWQTVGTPRLLVIGPYRMGFSLVPIEDSDPNSNRSTHLTVSIDYALPVRGLPRILGSALVTGMPGGARPVWLRTRSPCSGPEARRGPRVWCTARSAMWYLAGSAYEAVADLLRTTELPSGAATSCVSHQYTRRTRSSRRSPRS
jgi:hypothetical protein